MIKATLQSDSVPSQERLSLPSPEFQNIIQRLQKQIPEDETLQSIQVETLTEQDLFAWNLYLQLIERLDHALENGGTIIPGQRSLFERILKNLRASPFEKWMRNRILPITSHLDIIDLDPHAKTELQEYTVHEKERFIKK